MTVVIAVGIVLVATRSTGQATSGGDPYSVPFVTDTNPDPNIVETSITAKEATVDIGNGVQAHAQTFNGALPGPTFNLKVGDTVIVHYQNQLSKQSGIHWHGIELANAMDGTPFTQNQVAPGGSFLYKFTVHRPGIFWYHPHHHSSTNQVFKGLYGMILVEDPNDLLLRNAGILPPASQTKPLVLSDMTVCKNPPGNDTSTYDSTPPTDPWVGGANLPAQAPPTPKTLCETAPLTEEGTPGPQFSAGDIPNIQSDPNNLTPANARTNEGQTVLSNGKNVGARAGGPGPGAPLPGALSPNASKLDVQSGQGLRLQILNSAPVRYMRLRLTTQAGALVPLIRVGGEGGLIDDAVEEGGTPGGFDTKYTLGEQLIPPGSRADVVAAIPPGLPVDSVLTLWTEDYSRTGGGFSNIATVPVMHLHVTGTAPGAPYTISNGTPLRSAIGDTVPDLGAATGFLLNPLTFTPPKIGKAPPNLESMAVTQDVVNPRSLGIDNVVGTHDVSGDYEDAAHLGSTRYAKVGDTLDLTVENQTGGAHHPFHLHGFSIQPISLTKPANPTYTFPQEFRDNVDIPPGYKLRFLIKITDRALADGVTPGGALGRWVFHCHIFFHATNGMLSELVVTDPNGDERPDVNVDTATVEVKQGQTASMTGTFKDPDGDPVSLSSSVGTVTKNGNKWSWSYPTGADNTRVVYVTATDSKGLKSQIPFYLKIDNSNPTLNLPGPQKIGTGNLANILFSASDSDPDALKLTGSDLAAKLTVKDRGNRTAKIKGRATAPPGTSTATLAANDGHNAPVTKPLKITITPFAMAVDPTERLTKGGIGAGCRFYKKSARSCRFLAKSGGKGAGSASASLRRAGAKFIPVKIRLRGSVRRKVAKSLGGVPVTISASGRKFKSKTVSKATETTKVVAPRVLARPTFDAFGANNANLTAQAATYLDKLAGTVDEAKRIVCTAHPDSGGAAQAKSRAGAVCSRLQNAGLAAKFKSVGAKRPRNRRISITIIR